MLSINIVSRKDELELINFTPKDYNFIHVNTCVGCGKPSTYIKLYITVLRRVKLYFSGTTWPNYTWLVRLNRLFCLVIFVGAKWNVHAIKSRSTNDNLVSHFKLLIPTSSLQRSTNSFLLPHFGINKTGSSQNQLPKFT